MARHERYLFLPWGRDAIRWATRRGEETRGGAATSGERAVKTEEGEGNYVFRESGELPSRPRSYGSPHWRRKGFASKLLVLLSTLFSHSKRPLISSYRQYERHKECKRRREKESIRSAFIRFLCERWPIIILHRPRWKSWRAMVRGDRRIGERVISRNWPSKHLLSRANIPLQLSPGLLSFFSFS